MRADGIGWYGISVKTVYLVLFEGFIGILTFFFFFPIPVDMFSIYFGRYLKGFGVDIAVLHWQ